MLFFHSPLLTVFFYPVTIENKKNSQASDSGAFMVKNQAFQAFFKEALPPLKRVYTSTSDDA